MPKPALREATDSVVKLRRDEPLRHLMRKNACKIGREMVCSRVAQLYAKSFGRRDKTTVWRGLRRGFFRTNSLE
jgi:hypothetical protein